MSREQIYEVDNDTVPLNNWIKLTREKGENAWVGELNNCELSNEISEDNNVSVVQNCTGIWNCGVSSKRNKRAGASMNAVGHTVQSGKNEHKLVQEICCMAGNEVSKQRTTKQQNEDHNKCTHNSK